MKKKQTISNWDSDEKRTLTLGQPKKVEIDIATSKDEFKTNFDEGKHSVTRAKKLSEMSSSLHNKDFYTDNLKSKPDHIISVNTKDRRLETFEIEAKNGFEKMGSNEIKYLFAKQG
jgi:hypothetical protein